MRYRVVIGSATAVLLLAATSALVFRGGFTPWSELPQLPAAPVAQGEPTPAAPARSPVPIPPSFDVVPVKYLSTTAWDRPTACRVDVHQLDCGE